MIPTTSCCDSPVMRGPEGGAIKAQCHDCDDELCSKCAATFEREDGYGYDGREIRTFALCESCEGHRRYVREEKEREEWHRNYQSNIQAARNDSGV